MHCAHIRIGIPAQKGHPSKAGVKTLMAKSVDQCWNSGFAMVLSCLPFDYFFLLSVWFPHILKGEFETHFNSCSVMTLNLYFMGIQ